MQNLVLNRRHVVLINYRKIIRKMTALLSEISIEYKKFTFIPNGSVGSQDILSRMAPFLVMLKRSQF